jgi:hypothetical protein
MEYLERKLDSFDRSERKEALCSLVEKWRAGEVILPEPKEHLNVHIHTFYSYNTYGYSPSKVAWLARKEGLAVAGIVDFDVLDGLEEFVEATKMLSMKSCVGMETRVFIPEFADKVITSFGEPGITYHMGIGFPTALLRQNLEPFYRNLRDVSQQRNRSIIERVNRYLAPVELDYIQDVCSVTPAGNVTERHICDAYALKAKTIFKKNEELAGFWSDKLKMSTAELDLPDGYKLISSIRAKTMKAGGVGYIPPETGAFLRMEEFNHFVAEAGGIPALTWVDGISEGEQHIEELCRLGMKSGVAAINAIPDTRYTPHKDAGDQKLANLYALVELAQKLGLLMIVGTEMNIPGQRFVDDFNSKELAPLLGYFLKSAYVFYAHSVMQRYSGLGYMSDWANKCFKNRTARNDFFACLGEKLRPEQESVLMSLKDNISPEEIMKIVENTEITNDG